MTSIDVSFSPCWAYLSTPFLKIVTATLSSNISAFFSKLGLLSSVDLSYVSWCGDRHTGKASVKQALYDILTCSSSLTRLEYTDTFRLDCVCDVLRATNRFSKLKFLENMDKRNNQYYLSAENCLMLTGENVHDYCSKHALRNFASFSDVVTLYDARVLRRSGVTGEAIPVDSCRFNLRNDMNTSSNGARKNTRRPFRQRSTKKKSPSGRRRSPAMNSGQALSNVASVPLRTTAAKTFSTFDGNRESFDAKA